MAEGATAQSQFEAGQIAEARKTINRAIESRDDIVDLHLVRARIELAAHSPDTAFDAYSDALSLDAGNTEALLGVAQLGLQTGHRYESEHAADKVLTLDPTQPQALLIKGLHNIVRHRNEDALANADAILSKSPQDESAAILRARALSMLNRPEEALLQIETISKVTGKSLAVAKTLLELYRQKDDARGVIGQLEILRKYDPSDRALVIDEANTLYKIGDTGKARAFLHSLIFDTKIDDDTAKLVTNMWDEYDSAPLSESDLASIGTKAGMSARKAVARYYLDHNDPKRAQRAIGDGMSDDDLVGLGAQVAIATGSVDAGLKSAEAILANDKTHCDALLARAQAELAKRRFNDAIIDAQSTNASCPKLVPGYLALARAQEGAGNKVAADLAFRQGIDRNVQDSRLARIYTGWLERSGKASRAVSTARRLTKSAPALVSGWQLYLDICTRVSEADCTVDATEGMARAKRRFGIDRRPDEAPPIGLFGRLEGQ